MLKFDTQEKNTVTSGKISNKKSSKSTDQTEKIKCRLIPGKKQQTSGSAGLNINIFLSICQDIRCDVNLVGHMSDKNVLSKPKIFFSEKSFAQQNDIKKSGKQNKSLEFTGKNVIKRSVTSTQLLWKNVRKEVWG